MPKFHVGDPQVTFKRRDGRKFTKTFHGRTEAAKAVIAWRRKGGKVAGTGVFAPMHRGSKHLYVPRRRKVWGVERMTTSHYRR